MRWWGWIGLVIPLWIIWEFRNKVLEPFQAVLWFGHIMLLTWMLWWSAWQK